MPTLLAILGSAVVAAFVSGVVSFVVAERRIAMENVTQERAKWRKNVRRLSNEILNAAPGRSPTGPGGLQRMHWELGLFLNPHDPEDVALLRVIQHVGSETQDSTEVFWQRVRLLLKHDWERAKYEASWCRWIAAKPPPRQPFDDFRRGLVWDYRVSRWRCV